MSSALGGVPDIDQASATLEALDFQAEVPCDSDTEHIFEKQPTATTYWFIHCTTFAACDHCSALLAEYRGKATDVEHLECNQRMNTATLRELGPVKP